MTDLLIAVGLGGLLSLLGAIAGAYIMFKAMKRQPHESFFGGVPKGEVFSIDDVEEEPEEETVIPETVLKRVDTFAEQFAERLRE